MPKEIAGSDNQLHDPYAKINVLTISHAGKTAQTLIYIPPYSHIKTTGIKFIQLFLPAADTTGRQE